MKIINNYDGSSIDIIENDKTNNIVYLSLKDNNKYNHYFNFKVDNSNNKEGTIIIKDFTKNKDKKSQNNNNNNNCEEDINEPNVFESSCSSYHLNRED